MPTVSVKWQKEVYSSVEIDTSQPPYVFKCQLYDLTGVPPERQKIMVKGGLLKDDADWSTLGVKEGQKLMMMGTADEIMKAPEKAPVFVEDLPEEEQVVAVAVGVASADQFPQHQKLILKSQVRFAVGIESQPRVDGLTIHNNQFPQQSLDSPSQATGSLGRLAYGYSGQTLKSHLGPAMGKKVGNDSITDSSFSGEAGVDPVQGHSAGLFNLGNTCYMNSTIQCLHSVPELKSALIKYPPSVRSNDLDQSSHLLTVATRDLFNELDKNVKPVAPMQFWTVLRKKYPQFGQLNNGLFMQQDAEECWTQILYTLSQALSLPSSSENLDTVKGLFGIELVSRVHCAESGEESSETESVYSLKCHISQEVNHLHEGLRHGLKSELEKASPSLGRSAIYLKDSRIKGLPRYLTIQFVRFFWKRESNQKAKILR
ncbi:LOW QUALITY PROTEIN: hypothetical protein RJ639_024812, partial [Escallonia herrerae]